jgi:hypothetical protein
MELHRRLASDLPFFAKNALRIKTKAGNLEPFVFNKAQLYIDAKLNEQLAATGMVRALILKGRQQGCSTYVSARYYQRAVWQSSKSIFILSHEATSTENLFQIVDRYRETSPPQLKPTVEISNRRQLRFKNGSEYRLGTAGAGSTGRSQTNQYFHGSEVAFYERTDEVRAGVLQTVADLPGTEVILESTANGIGNAFHQMCMDALSGTGRYQLIFVPWYWQDEYTATPMPDHAFTREEVELQRIYGLTDGQLYWRYLKIMELGERTFKQEYPFTVEEAFQSSGTSLIPSISVARARAAKLSDPTRPIVIGVDPARQGDRTAICIRQGRCILDVIKYGEMNEMRLAGILANLFERYNPVKCFIDAAHGWGTVDRLHELGYGDIAQAVHFSEKPLDDRFLNKRAEMIMAVRDWLMEELVSIPDDDELATDLLCVPDYKETSRGAISIEPKDKIKQAYGKSPDLFDAVALTFAYPVASRLSGTAQQMARTAMSRHGSPLRTRSHIRPRDPDSPRRTIRLR